MLMPSLCSPSPFEPYIDNNRPRTGQLNRPDVLTRGTGMVFRAVVVALGCWRGALTAGFAGFRDGVGISGTGAALCLTDGRLSDFTGSRLATTVSSGMSDAPEDGSTSCWPT